MRRTTAHTHQEEEEQRRREQMRLMEAARTANALIATGKDLGP